MEFKQEYKNDHFRAVRLILNKEEQLPDHKTASEALLIVVNGKAKIHFSEREILLEQGITFTIPANEIHKVEAIEDFSAIIIFPTNKKP